MHHSITALLLIEHYDFRHYGTPKEKVQCPESERSLFRRR